MQKMTVRVTAHTKQIRYDTIYVSNNQKEVPPMESFNA